MTQYIEIKRVNHLVVLCCFGLFMLGVIFAHNGFMVSEFAKSTGNGYLAFSAISELIISGILFAWSITDIGEAIFGDLRVTQCLRVRNGRVKE